MILQQKMAKACSVLWIGTIIYNMIVQKAKVVLHTNEFTEVPKYVIFWTAKFQPVLNFTIKFVKWQNWKVILLYKSHVKQFNFLG